MHFASDSLHLLKVPPDASSLPQCHPVLCARRLPCQLRWLQLLISLQHREGKVQQSFILELKVNGVLTPDAAASDKSIQVVWIIHQARRLHTQKASFP